MQICWRPTPQRLAAELARSRARELTYVEVGATLADELPAGYHHIDVATAIGAGRTAFDTVADALVRWELQRAAGMTTSASSPTAVAGATVVNAAGRPLTLLAPCRVVGAIDEPTRRGFAYGTLPGHPLRGEERFTVEVDGADVVRLRIVSFSRPAGVATLAPALVRAGQRAVNARYAAAARRLAAGRR